MKIPPEEGGDYDALGRLVISARASFLREGTNYRL